MVGKVMNGRGGKRSDVEWGEGLRGMMVSRFGGRGDGKGGGVFWFRHATEGQNERLELTPGKSPDNVETNFPAWFNHKIREKKVNDGCSEELFSLACGPISTCTYPACIVNGVKFVVHERDILHTTQCSGVSTLGLDGMCNYGQLEEILELTYIGNQVDASPVNDDNANANEAILAAYYIDHTVGVTVVFHQSGPNGPYRASAKVPTCVSRPGMRPKEGRSSGDGVYVYNGWGQGSDEEQGIHLAARRSVGDRTKMSGINCDWRSIRIGWREVFECCQSRAMNTILNPIKGRNHSRKAGKIIKSERSLRGPNETWRRTATRGGDWGLDMKSHADQLERRHSRTRQIKIFDEVVSKVPTTDCRERQEVTGWWSNFQQARSSCISRCYKSGGEATDIEDKEIKRAELLRKQKRGGAKTTGLQFGCIERTDAAYQNSDTMYGALGRGGGIMRRWRRAVESD
ncbi:hypothetical protein Tco_0695327 [Tanacetum coccineum]